MSGAAYAVLQSCAVAVVIAQPIFGWTAIPKFFNYSSVSALMLGVADFVILFAPVLAWALTN